MLLMRDFLAAIGKVFPAACPEARALVTAPNSVPLRILGRTLANELDTMASRIA